MTNNSATSVSLVLGSGGARGLAHIGVIRWLEEHNYQIKSIAGCSIGALIGGVYAAGKLDEFEHWIRAISKVDIVSLLDISWRGAGLVKGDKIIDTLTDLIGDLSIEQLPMKFTAVATDLQHEKEIWINSGRLFDAIRASISLPLFFTPYPYKNRVLIDGGVLNPVPIAPVFSDKNEVVLAVNLGGPAEMVKKLAADQRENNGDHSLHEKVLSYIKNLASTDTLPHQQDWNLYDIANQAFDAMQSTIARQKLAAYPPDAVIEIARNACGTLEFDRATEMIALGYQQTGMILGKKSA